MKIPHPFIPVRATSENGAHTIAVVDRTYTIGVDGMITSIRSQGVELLAGPMRVVAVEDGEPSNWDTDYATNESESFVQTRSDEQIIICGAKQSDRFIVDTCYTIDYDGCMEIDCKVMPRGQTVAQVFGIAETKPTLFKLDQLWIELPLRAEAMPYYHMYPNSAIYLADGSTLPMHDMTTSGRLPEQDFSLPHKALFWLGNEQRGLGFFSEEDFYWQPEKASRAIELVREGEQLILRLRLLDSHPAEWDGDPARGMLTYRPIDFHFGFHATPVKPFPKNPYISNTFHLDCGIKIKGNYIDFLSAENRFDKLKEMGVTTLILHEKWNKSQNWFDLSEFTKKQVCYIADECHKRGIKLLTYFGYEFSSMSPEWSRLKDRVLLKNTNGKSEGGWWRVPFQRDYVVCYGSEYEDIFIHGVEKIMDECHTDGVYLDGTHHLRCCTNQAHGCGRVDRAGNVHGRYAIRAVRSLFKRLYDVVESRGGMINVHGYGFINFTAIPYIHQNWYGETLQFALMKGQKADLNLDYFRAEYIGRNIGAPVEFIAYENRPLWTFEQALSCSILHGILPRPNDIGHPLDLMSCVWRIFDAFPIAQSEWMPYWENKTESSHEKVKVSYYRYTTLSGKQQLLAFAVNISATPVESVTLSFAEDVTRVRDMEKEADLGFTFSLGAYGYRILFVE